MTTSQGPAEQTVHTYPSPSASQRDTAGFHAGMDLPGLYRYDIRGTDTDYHDRLHLASLFALMQEAAYHNAENLGMGASQLDPAGYCWLLARISVRMLRLPRWTETMSVETWSRGPRKLLFLRDFIFYAGTPDQSEVIGQATSEWLIAHKETHRPVRPDKLLDPGRLTAYLSQPAALDFDCPKLPALLTAGDESDAVKVGTALRRGSPILVKYADFSDIDRNQHVNNTRYVAWAVDAVQAFCGCEDERTNRPALPDQRVTGLDIQYISEVLFGSKIQLYACDCRTVPACEAGDSARMVLVEGQLAETGKAVFRARVHLA